MKKFLALLLAFLALAPAAMAQMSEGAVMPGTLAPRSSLIGCVYNTTAPVATNGQQQAVQCGSGGALVVGPSSISGMSTSSAIVANNTTSVAIDANPGTLYAVRVFNNSATIAYLKLYNAAQGSTTCGSGTPVMRILIPANASGAGAVINVGGGLGVYFSTAITRCVTTGIADNDTGAPGATTYIVEADYK